MVKGRFTFSDDRSLALRNTAAQLRHIFKKIKFKIEFYIVFQKNLLPGLCKNFLPRWEMLLNTVSPGSP